MSKKENQHIEWLIKAMEKAFQKDKGFWADSLLDAIDGLTAEQAAWKPRQQGTRSIWEIVRHVAFWKNAIVRNLERKPWADVSEHKGWPPVTEASEAAWAETVEQLENLHGALIQCVSQLQDESLDKPFPGEEEPLREDLFGLIAHDSYHTGQILTLRQLQGISI